MKQTKKYKKIREKERKIDVNFIIIIKNTVLSSENQ